MKLSHNLQLHAKFQTITSSLKRLKIETSLCAIANIPRAFALGNFDFLIFRSMGCSVYEFG